MCIKNNSLATILPPPSPSSSTTTAQMTTAVTSTASITNNPTNINTKSSTYDTIINKISPITNRKSTSLTNKFYTTKPNQVLLPYHQQHSDLHNNLIGITSSNNNNNNSNIQQQAHTTRNKSVSKGLTINTSPDAENYHNSGVGANVNGYSYKGSYSTTNQTYAQNVGLSKNLMISNLSGTLTTKYPRHIESYITDNIALISSPNKQSSNVKNLTNMNNNAGLNQMKQILPTASPAASGQNFKPISPNQTPLNSATQAKNHQQQQLQATKALALDQSKLTPSSSINTSQTQLNLPCTRPVKSGSSANHSSTNSSSVSKPPQNNESTNLMKGNPQSSTNLMMNCLNLSRLPNDSTNTMLSPHGSGNSSNTPLTGRKFLNCTLPNHEPTKCSVKRNGLVKAYAANTNQGIVRNYNEDRVSIILNIMKPASRKNENWPKCSYFGVYDGHGGVKCADFLRDNLHQFVIQESTFPTNPKEALIKGFEAAEKHFLELAENNPTGEIDRSGSCAIVVLIVGDICYVANVGDSRAVLSGDAGSKVFPLSRDHKPMDELEQKRILEAGGKIYQSQTSLKGPENTLGKAQMQLLLGPHRVLPGRLSVSRTFGDIEAKMNKFGGNPNVVISTPDIKVFKIVPEHDFIILASDGIYDKLSSRDVVKCIWDSTEQEKACTIHQQCGIGVERILRESINKRTLDNITVVMICFKNFQKQLFPSKKERMNTENVEDKEAKSQGFIKTINMAVSRPIIKTIIMDKKAEQENQNQSQAVVNNNMFKKLNLLGDNNSQYNANNHDGKLMYTVNLESGMINNNALSKKPNEFYEIVTESSGILANTNRMNVQHSNQS